MGCNGEPADVGRVGARSAVAHALTSGDDPLDAPQELLDAARELLGARLGQDPATLVITNAAPVTFPLLQRSLYRFKALDGRGDVQSIALNNNGTREEDFEALEGLEASLYQQDHGQLTPDLAEQLAVLPDEEEIEVAIQALVPQGDSGGPMRPDPSTNLSDSEVDALYTAVDAHRSEVARVLTAPIKQRLGGLGYQGEADALAPIVHVKLPVHLIREAARWNDVSKIFASATYESTMNVARATVEADVVNSRGITGTGVRVAEIEVGGMLPAANPFLAGTTQDPVSACFHPHATWVAGTIRSTHATIRGVSPDVNLRVGGSCAGSGSQLVSRSTAASSWGARAFNLSFGSNAGTQPGALDNYYDDLVQNGWRTVVVSAGNSGPSAIVGSPGRAYNVLTVGAIDDHNTIPWLGDTMSTFSSSLDPVSLHGDREKPEVVAPGTSITTTSPTSPWVGATVSGTSFSAPITTGSAALLMRRSSGLQVWPEAVKAILMATAVHNVEGATRLSERDGAGAIVDGLADDIAHGVSGNWGGRAYSCGVPTIQNVTTMSLVSNRVTRVAVTWDTNPSYNQYAGQPSADLDVTILGPSGAVVAGSGSWDNPYEMIEFTAPVTGTYTVRVHKYRCSLTPKWLGWAWYQNY
ncbi:MAG: S8 family serine peptidase [Kofleriaceae bacterium]